MSILIGKKFVSMSGTALHVQLDTKKLQVPLHAAGKTKDCLQKTLLLQRTLVHTFEKTCQIVSFVILRESVLSNFSLSATRFLVAISILHIQSYVHTRLQSRIKFLAIHHGSVQQDRDGSQARLDQGSSYDSYLIDYLIDLHWRNCIGWKQRVKILFAAAFEAESEKSKCNYIKYWLGEEGLPLIRKWGEYRRDNLHRG